MCSRPADYNNKTDYAKIFFSTVQNKFHYAITGLTASEIVTSRIDSQKKIWGLPIERKYYHARARQVAKNYLQELELKRLNLLVEQFCLSRNCRVWNKSNVYEGLGYETGCVLILNDKAILDNSGNVSHHDMEQKSAHRIGEL